MIKKSFPVSLLVLILFIAIINGFAYKFSWYWRIPWLDMPMHFLGGFWVGSVVLWFYFLGAYTQHLRILLASLLAVIVVGVLWELFEFNIDTIVSVSEQNGTLDTGSDIMFDIIGGTAAAVYFIFKK